MPTDPPPLTAAAMHTVYYRNRIVREMPHTHRCNTCGLVEACPVQPCYRPVNAPFSLCDPCRDREIAATLALCEQEVPHAQP